MRSGLRRSLLVIFCVLALSMCANASVILSLVSGSPTPSGSNFEWDYSVALSGDQNFRTNDWTEVIDFGGFVSATWTAGALTSVSLTTQLTGPGNPPGGGSDSASITNVVITNTGSTILGNGSVQNLGTLKLISTQGTTAGAFIGGFSTQAQKVSDLTTTFNQGFLPVPTQPSGVPEPATMALLGGGLIGFAFLRRAKP